MRINGRIKGQCRGSKHKFDVPNSVIVNNQKKNSGYVRR